LAHRRKDLRSLRSGAVAGPLRSPRPRTDRRGAAAVRGGGQPPRGRGTMSVDAYAADDQAAFIAAMAMGAARAEAEVGYRDHHFSIAGHCIRLRIAGEGFAGKLPTALGHLASPPAAVPALTIRA